jgi:aminoglycoside 6'-N-acetyltransferase
MDAPLDPSSIGFRFLADEDLPRVWGWLSNPAVRAWYHDGERSLEDVVAGYGPKLHGRGDVLACIITYGGRPIGYIQRYLTAEHADYWGHQGFPTGTAGIDLFIGEDAFRHRGLGVEIIRAFLRERVFADPAIARCIIDPDPANRAAIRAYEKAGFRHLRTISPPRHIEPAYLMILERADFAP